MKQQSNFFNIFVIIVTIFFVIIVTIITKILNAFLNKKSMPLMWKWTIGIYNQKNYLFL